MATVTTKGGASAPSNVLPFPVRPAPEPQAPAMPAKSPELALCLAILSTMNCGQQLDVLANLRRMRDRDGEGSEAALAFNLLDGRL